MCYRYNYTAHTLIKYVFTNKDHGNKVMLLFFLFSILNFIE